MPLLPDRYRDSLRHFGPRALAEIAIIMFSVLVALWCNGLVEQSKERKLVAEARANIKAELQENRSRLLQTRKKTEGQLAAVRQNLKQLTTVLEAKSGTFEVHLNNGFTPVLFMDTSWQTAQSTGAIRHMPYQEVKAYTAVRHFEGEVQRLQHELQPGLMALNAASLSTPEELRDCRRRTKIFESYLSTILGYGAGLLERYEEVLGKP